MVNVRRGVLAGVASIALLAMGAGIGIAVGDVLGIRTEPAEVIPAPEATVPAVAEAIAPPEITVRDAPDTALMDAARQSLEKATDAAPHTAGTASVTVQISDDAASADQSYRLTGESDALTVDAADEAGAARALFDMAAAIRAGRAIDERTGEEVTDRLPMRMLDLGAVAVDADPSQWESGTDYSHASRAFEDVYLAEAPYIDEAALADGYADWEVFLERALENGYNAVAWPGAVEFMTFADVPDGPVYPEGDDHIGRAEALRDAFGPFWDRANELGIDIFLRTDMPTLTPELASYFDRRFGGLDTENPQFWEVYTAGLQELYDVEPGLSGVMLRIGEGGGIYKDPSWDYYSQIAVRTVAGVQTMLNTYADHAEASGSEVIFRTWSVGIGEVGDMHTDQESYRTIFDGVSSPALIVSTKYTMGDFDSWLPMNDTLEIGDQRRIIEIQGRREFEAFGAFPNDLGTELQTVLNDLLETNPNIEGVWTWTQDGGPWRAGPMTLYLKHGFWQLYELNVQLAGALARDPGADVGQLTADWAREWFSDDPATVQAIGEAMALSRPAILQGLYIEPFAENRAFALGLEPPPMMWIFKWDILSGDAATHDVMYQIIGEDRIDEAVALGEQAVADAERMGEIIAATDPENWRDPALHEAFVGAVDYEVDTLRLLTSYRELFLLQAQWRDTLSPEVLAARDEARDEFVALAEPYLERYEGDVAHPAWNLDAALDGVERADRDPAMAWMARGLLVLALAWVVIGMISARTPMVRRPGAAAARATWLGSTRPWRARESILGILRTDRWMLLIVPVALLVGTRAIQTSFLSWVHLAVVLAAWVVFALVARWLLGSRHTPFALIAAVGGAVVLRCIVTLFALSFAGPSGYWFAFLTDPTRRVLYIAVAFALFVWVFVAAGWAISVQIGVRRATGAVLGAVGAGLALPSLAIAVIGFEEALTAWNDQVGLLPYGLSRILGITTHLGIPDETPWVLCAAGVVLCIAGVLLSLRRRRVG